MKESKSDLILHPIRLKIIQTLIGGRRLTVQQINELLPDIPQATLYRHLNKLSSAGIVTVVDQNQVRGTVEKIYALDGQGASLTQEDLKTATRDDHMRYFLSFLANVVGDYEKYLAQNHFDMMADGVAYRQARLYLTDEEFTELMNTIGSAFQKALQKDPTPDRRCRIISTIIVPEPRKES